MGTQTWATVEPLVETLTLRSFHLNRLCATIAGHVNQLQQLEVKGRGCLFPELIYFHGRLELHCTTILVGFADLPEAAVTSENVVGYPETDETTQSKLRHRCNSEQD